jgi:hypothetical protein
LGVCHRLQIQDEKRFGSFHGEIQDTIKVTDTFGIVVILPRRTAACRFTRGPLETRFVEKLEKCCIAAAVQRIPPISVGFKSSYGARLMIFGDEENWVIWISIVACLENIVIERYIKELHKKSQEATDKRFTHNTFILATIFVTENSFLWTIVMFTAWIRINLTCVQKDRRFDLMSSFLGQNNQPSDHLPVNTARLIEFHNQDRMQRKRSTFHAMIPDNTSYEIKSSYYSPGFSSQDIQVFHGVNPPPQFQ